MTKKSLFNKSRIEARKLMRLLHPEISRNKWYVICVHHIDGNPSNNDISNLQIIDRREHKKLHCKIKEYEKSHARINKVSSRLNVVSHRVINQRRSASYQGGC